MRVVRIKHKAGIAVFLVAFVLLLLVLISRHSSPEIHVNKESLNIPTRTVDFINIAKNVLVRPNNEDDTGQDGLQNTPLSRGKLKSHFRKQPRPPKRRVSDGIVDKAKDIKNVVHGDALQGPSRGNHGHQRGNRKHKQINHDAKGVFFEQVVNITRFYFFWQ